MAAPASRPRQAGGVNAAAGPSSRANIHLPTAYDRFDNGKRNRWIDDLQRKIRDGLNGPVSPGPSRSPSPLNGQDGAEEDVFGDIGAAVEDGLRDDRHTLEVQINGYHEESEEEEEEEDDGMVGSGGLEEEEEDEEEDQLMSDPLYPEDVLPDQEGLDGEYADEASQGEEEEQLDYEDDLDEDDGEEEGAFGERISAQPQVVDYIGSSEDERPADQDELEDAEEEEQDEDELEDEPYDGGFPPTISEAHEEDQSPFPASAEERAGVSFGASSSSLYPTLPQGQSMTIDPRHLAQSFLPAEEPVFSPGPSPSEWPTTTGFGVPSEMIDPILLQQLAQEAENADKGMYPDLPPAVSAAVYEGDAGTTLRPEDHFDGDQGIDYLAEDEDTRGPSYEEEEAMLPSGGQEPIEEEEEEEPVEDDDEEVYDGGSQLQRAFGDASLRGPFHDPTPDNEVIELLSSSDEEGPEEDEEEEEEEEAYEEDEREPTPSDDAPQQDQLQMDGDDGMDNEALTTNTVLSLQPQPVYSESGHDRFPAADSSVVVDADGLASPVYANEDLPPLVQPDSSTFDEPPVVQAGLDGAETVYEDDDQPSQSAIQTLPEVPYMVIGDSNPRLVSALPPQTVAFSLQEAEDEDYESEATPEPVDPALIAKAFGDDEGDGEASPEDDYEHRINVEEIEVEEMDEDGSLEQFSRTIVQEVFEPISHPLTPGGTSPQMEYEELKDEEGDVEVDEQSSLADEELNDAPETMDPTVEDVDMETTVHAVSVVMESTIGSTDRLAESATAASIEADMGYAGLPESPESAVDQAMDTEDATPALPDPYVPPRDTSMPIPFLLRTPRTSPSPSASVLVAPSEAPPPIIAVSELDILPEGEREETPVEMPDPHEPPPDTKVPSPQIPLRSLSRSTPTPSLVVEPPFNPPEPSSVDVRQEAREETPPDLPDPSLPPPPLDDDRFSPLEASDFMDTHYSPTGSLVAEPPNQTPLPGSVVFDPHTIREETPTPLPDPRAAVPDTDIEAPLTPHQLKPSLITPSPSLIVEPPSETPWASKAGTVNEGSVDTPRGSRLGQEPYTPVTAEAKAGVDDEEMDQDVNPESPQRAVSIEPAEVAGPSKPPERLRHQHGRRNAAPQNGPATTAPPAPPPRTKSFHFTPTPTPDPEASSSAHLTRSQCFYRKLHLTDDEHDAVVLVPQCTLADTMMLEDEEAEDLGEPSIVEQVEGMVRPMTANDPLLDDPLAAKLHRIIGTQIANEGHCYLLSASDSALLPLKDVTPNEEDEEKTPKLGTTRSQDSARRSRRGSSKFDTVVKHTPSPRASPLLAPRQTRASARKSGISVEPETLERASASPRLTRRVQRSTSQASMSGSPGNTRRSQPRATSEAVGDTDTPARHTRSRGPAPPPVESSGEASDSQSTPRAQGSPARHTRSHISPSATPTPDSPPMKRTRRGRGKPRTTGADSLGFIKAEEIKAEEIDELDSIPRAEDNVQIDIKVESSLSAKRNKGRRSMARTTDDAPYRPAEESEVESVGEPEVKSEEEGPAKGKGRAGKVKAESSVPLDEAEDEENPETDAETDIVWDESAPAPQEKLSKRKSRRSLAAMKDNAAFTYDPSATATPDESDPEDDEDAPTPGRLRKGKRKSRPSMMDREASSLWKDTTVEDTGKGSSIGIETRSSKRRAVDDAQKPGSPVAVKAGGSLQSKDGGQSEKKGKKSWWRNPFGR